MAIQPRARGLGLRLDCLRPISGSINEQNIAVANAFGILVEADDYE